MRKAILVLLLLSNYSFAQKNNIIKINTGALIIKNYNLIYETAIGKNVSFSLGLRYMPKSATPFKPTIANMVKSPDFNIDNFKMGNTAVTPELRFYMGRKKMKGFYLAPYARYATFYFTFPVNRKGYTGPMDFVNPIVLNGKISSYSAGLLMGVQSNLSKRFVFDFWLLGGHYGKSNGTLSTSSISPEMTAQEQQDLQTTFDETVIDGPIKLEGKVINSTSAEITSKGPWAGLRCFTIALGYRF